MENNVLPVNLEGASDSIYPGFWVRLAALIIDGLIILAVQVPFMLLARFGKPVILSMLVVYVAAVFYVYVYCVAKWGASPGKMLFKMVILKKHGEKAQWNGALYRFSVDMIFLVLQTALTLVALSKIDKTFYTKLNYLQLTLLMGRISPSILLLNRISSAWRIANLITFFANQRRRILPDYIGGTVVIKKEYEQQVAEYVQSQKLTAGL